MKFKYRFKGKINSQFILRGMLFKSGTTIDFCVSEKELDFVKAHCEVVEIIDREPKLGVNPPETMLEKPKTEIKSNAKGGNGDVQQRARKGKNNNKNNQKVSLD